MRRSSCRGVAVANCTPDNDGTPSYPWKSSLATFLSGTAAGMGGRPYYYLIRSNGWKSMSLLSGLRPLDFSSVLLACEFVAVATKKDGSKYVKFSFDKFQQFITDWQLGGDVWTALWYIGNRLIARLEEVIDLEIEQISHKEFQIRGKKTTLEEMIVVLRDLKSVWLNSPDGGKALDSKRGRVLRIKLRTKKGVESTELNALSNETKQLEIQIASLVKARNHVSKHISDSEKSVTELNKKMKEISKSAGVQRIQFIRR